MSIAVLTQVYDEARRLAVAGSVVAHGDFRLKKLLPPLDQAGAKAPVFAKVADAARAVIDGPEDKSAESLLELTSLVTAVLYTQGETGLAGEMKPIESVNLGGTMAQTSARLLKPLLEALSNTGSGRLELIKEAQQRGAFRDIRLFKPALGGLDDPYPEVADFLAEHVLPVYGNTVLPELRAKYDPKGTKGHPRRLKLMHALDPAGTRELVKQALEDGSKEVKVAAISCLGAAKEDLSFLIEQASAKAQDVRQAAYEALAKIDDPAAVAVLEKAITGKDLEIASDAIEESKSDKLTAILVAEITKERDALPKLKDKKQVGEKCRRLEYLIGSLPDREHKAADALVLDLFAKRGELVKVKGDNFSGADVVEAVILRMSDGPKVLQTTLAKAHAELDAGELSSAFLAARKALPAAEVYDLFSPYLTADGGGEPKKAKAAASGANVLAQVAASLATMGKKKGKDGGGAKREAIIDALNGDYIHWYHFDDDENLPPLDPRWLDLAVKIKHLGLVNAVGKPGHKAAEAFVQAEYDARSKTAKSQDQLTDILTVMIRLKHPKAADALVASYEKTVGKANANTYWYYHLIPDLPKDAVPKLEALIPRLKDRELDRFVEAVQELRNK